MERFGSSRFMSVPQEIFGYPVVAKLGTGAASELYAVQDPRTKQVWALKHVIRRTEKDDRFIAQVEIEHEVGSKLDHPNMRRVGKIHRIRKLFTTTEIGLCLHLIDADAMDNRRPETLIEAVEQFAQIARGLGHMHSKGYVHADMKPINVMVLEDRSIQIIDLGQACKIGSRKERIQGTPGYIAPEQAALEKITAATDVYNLGATMYFMLVGEVIPTVLPPGSSKPIAASLLRMPQAPHERKPMIPARLGRLIMNCIRVKPEDRVASMDVVAAELDQIASELRGPVAVAGNRPGK
ncbi:MAG: serine/threonine protein kinase [Planctomycetes bacterium]|nr:serine/threonine protein kinase [Planctomycetota bacterium]